MSGIFEFYKREGSYQNLFFMIFTAGLCFGVYLYHKIEIKHLYQAIPGRYLTFTHEQSTQALGSFYRNVQSQKNLKNHILILGGSASYHALQLPYLETLINQKTSEPYRVSSVSFAYLSPVFMLYLVDELPRTQRQNNNVVICNWSFWNMAAQPEVLTYDSICPDRNLYHLKNLNVLKEIEGLVSVDRLKKNIAQGNKQLFSIWTKYFILDKLQKLPRMIRGHREKYSLLFRNYIIQQYSPKVKFSEEEMRNQRRSLLETKKTLQMNVIQHQANLKSSVDGYKKELDEIIDFDQKIIQKVKKMAEEKGYRFLLVDIPTKPQTSKELDFVNRKFKQTLNRSFGRREQIEIPNHRAWNDDLFWYDLIHMTPLGTKLYTESFSEKLIGYLQS